MSEWKETTLGELISIKHGWAFKSEFFDDTSYTKNNIVVAIGNFNYEGGFRFDSTKTKQYLGDYPKDYELDPGDILLAMTCQTAGGEILGIPGKIPNDGNLYLHNQRLGKVEIKNKDLLDPSFVYWLFLWKPFNYHLTATATGTKILHTSPSRIEEFTFKCPPIKTQKEIGKILDCLDRKIDNLRRQNETLEKIAQTLFKHWFIDFEFPNDDGKPYKSSGGAMVTSELGDIPEGWRVEKLGNILTVTDYVANGSFASLKENVTTYDSENYALYVRLVDYNNNFSTNLKYIDRSSFNFLSKSQLKGHEIIVSNIGANAGTIFRPPYWLKKPMVLGSNSIMFYSEQFTEYAYYFLSSYQGKLSLQSIIGGSAQPKFNKTDFRNLAIIVPDIKNIKLFNALALNIRDKIFNNNANIQTITKTRDTLLPKLMNGQIRVKEAEIIKDKS